MEQPEAHRAFARETVVAEGRMMSTTRLAGSASGEGRLVADLAEIDSRLRALDEEWKEVGRQRDSSRRELALTGARLERLRARAARQALTQGDESGGPRVPDRSASDEEEHGRLVRRFEAGLKDAETKRVSLHNESERLRNHKKATLRELPAAVRSAYEAAVRAGRVPAIATVAGGACRGCTSPIPPSLVQDLARGAAAVCPDCERLLCSTEDR